MDHIPYPQSPAIPPITIPYYVKPEHVYDGFGFKDFHRRKKVTWPSPDAVNVGMRPSIPRVLENAVSFVQSWLFFALIEETHKWLLPNGDDFRREDYIEREASSGVILTTKPLQDLMLAWESYDRSQGQDKRLRCLQNVKEYLEIATGFATGLMELAQCVAELNWVDYGMCVAIESLTLSIYCLCEALGKPGMLYTVNFSTLHTSTPELLDRRFQLSGFCAKEIRILANETFTVKYAASALDRRYDVVSHAGCTADFCSRDSLNESTYHRVHTEDCDKSKCFDVSPVPASGLTTSDILRQGGIPVVHLSSSKDTCNVLSACSEGSNIPVYVAISHVWSDGLGNITENAIRVCQVRRLQLLVNDLYPERTTDCPFWIDTLCVPREKELKKLAIKRMKACYQQADKVVVLDSVLRQIPVAFEPTDSCLRLMTSRWRFRLWTLQEAIFAKDLYYQFQDQAITLSHFDGYYNEKFPPMPGEPPTSALNSTTLRTPLRRMHMEPLLSDISRGISGLYPLLHGLTEDWKILERIENTLAYRVTTNKEDEAICLASLLGFDPSSVVGLHGEDSMIALFNSFQKVPLGLLFSARGRTVTPGFRWIPDTFLWQGGSGSFPAYGEACSFDRNGMYVTLPGAKLSRDPQAQHSSTWYVRTRYHGVNAVLSICDEELRANFCKFRSERLCIVSRHLLGLRRRNTLGVLLILNEVMPDSCIRASWIANLAIAAEEICPEWFVNDAPRASVAEEFNATQKWCIG